MPSLCCTKSQPRATTAQQQPPLLRSYHAGFALCRIITLLVSLAGVAINRAYAKHTGSAPIQEKVQCLAYYQPCPDFITPHSVLHDARVDAEQHSMLASLSLSWHACVQVSTTAPAVVACVRARRNRKLTQQLWDSVEEIATVRVSAALMYIPRTSPKSSRDLMQAS
jgi:hypothetical protein